MRLQIPSLFREFAPIFSEATHAYRELRSVRPAGLPRYGKPPSKHTGDASSKKLVRIAVMDLALNELHPTARTFTSLTRIARGQGSLVSGDTEQNQALGSLRASVAALDAILGALPPDPAGRCPASFRQVAECLQVLQSALAESPYLLTRRVVARTAALVERLRSDAIHWELLSKLAIEELVSVVDLVADVIELVGTDSGCRQEERISFRILASVAPQVLVELDSMSFREIRFHQASMYPHAARVA